MADNVAEPDRASDEGAAPSAPTGGLGRAIAAGVRGEAMTGRAVLDMIGGVRGVLESLAPALLFLVLYVVTRDARLSVIAPLAVAVLAFGVRLARRQHLMGALTGLIGVVVCVGATLLTGRGQDFFLPGFWINGAWIAAHGISLIVGWPLVGLLLGFFRGSLTAWRQEPAFVRAARWLTLMWIGLFALRLLVQVPLYLASGSGSVGAIEALGLARLVMGVPLFALAALFTWQVLGRVSQAVDGLHRAAAEAARLREEGARDGTSDE